MARYGLFVLKVPLNTNQPTNQPTMLGKRRLVRVDTPFHPFFLPN